jgi:hypothetical protein
MLEGALNRGVRSDCACDRGTPKGDQDFSGRALARLASAFHEAHITRHDVQG